MTEATLYDTQRATCVRCASQLAPSLLSCPACHALVHRDRLSELASEATAAEARGERALALTRWRDAIALLPAESPQHPIVAARIESLGKEAPAAARAERQLTIAGIRARFAGKGGRIGSTLAAAAVLLWKLKFVVVFVLTKLKLLLLGFSKMGTLLSMLATIGVYWAVWGWPFAVGFVLSIYVHEMGHVSALRHYGIRASAPMFIPFVGAFVRLKESLHGTWENAMVGLAGPLWGLGAAVLSYGLYLVTSQPIFAAIAHTGAWVNLFNLLPVWQLDGGRGFGAMSRNQRLVAAGATFAAFAVTRDPILLLVGIVAAVVAFMKPSAAPDVRIAAYYVGVLWALAAVSALSNSAALGAVQSAR